MPKIKKSRQLLLTTLQGARAQHLPLTLAPIGTTPPTTRRVR